MAFLPARGSVAFWTLAFGLEKPVGGRRFIAVAAVFMELGFQSLYPLLKLANPLSAAWWFEALRV